MRIKQAMDNNRDTMGWGIGGIILTMISASWIELLAGLVFPTIGWIVLYFVKREIIYRFPSKKKKAELEEGLDTE